MFTHVLASGRVWRAVRKQQQEVTLRAARSEWCWNERSETEVARGDKRGCSRSLGGAQKCGKLKTERAVTGRTMAPYPSGRVDRNK